MMKRLLLISIGFTSLFGSAKAGEFYQQQTSKSQEFRDSLPLVFEGNHADLTGSRLKHEAILRYQENQLPSSTKEWEVFRNNLRKKIIEKAAIIVDHHLPFNTKETGTVKMKGYTIRNIAFQTRPGVYATANLYVPEGNGPFPAVVHMHGHWTNAKADEGSIQPVAHTLATNGYVVLTIDAFGAGERSTIDGTPEYHGSNLGASLMNIGESLMGFQISDNIRAVDLLTSLPYVDKNKIGATGASGGGNQTMWLTAMDDRIKAAVPVVSIGSFESYVMRSNCICELLVDGLTYTEEAGILGLAAPRAVKFCNHAKDDIPTFLPVEMFKSYQRVKPVFEMLGAGNNIDYRISDTTHGYFADDRSAMLGWFDLHLKGIGNGESKKELPFETVPSDKLMVFAKGQRPPEVMTIEQYCKKKGSELKNKFLAARSFNADLKRSELKNILRFDDKSTIKKVNDYSNTNGWDRIALETSDGKLIPILHFAPKNKALGYVILCHPKGKSAIAPGLIAALKQKGSGIVLADLSGTGEASSSVADSLDESMRFHTLSRSELWLGKTILGEWTEELNLIVQFLNSKYAAKRITIDGSREAALAGLFLNAVKGNASEVILRDAPISYLFDSWDSVNFYSMAIHLPRFLNWGDVSFAAALTGKNVRFINPLTMSGRSISKNLLEEYQKEYESMIKSFGHGGKIIFEK